MWLEGSERTWLVTRDHRRLLERLHMLDDRLHHAFRQVKGHVGLSLRMPSTTPESVEQRQVALRRPPDCPNAIGLRLKAIGEPQTTVGGPRPLVGGRCPVPVEHGTIPPPQQAENRIVVRTREAEVVRRGVP